MSDPSLYRLIESLSRTKDTQQIPLAVLDCIREGGLVCDSFTIALVDDSNGKLTFPVRYFARGNSPPRSPAAEHVVQTGLALYVPNVSAASDEIRGLLRDEGEPSSFIAIPVVSGDRLLGAISLGADRPEYQYDAADLQRAVAVSSLLGNALACAWLAAEHERELEKQHRILELAAAINSAADVNQVLRQVRDAVVEVGGFDRAGVFLYDEAEARMYGTWGTDRHGDAEDIRETKFLISDQDRAHWNLGNIDNAPDYDLIEDFDRAYHPDERSTMAGVHSHAILFLRTNRKTVGMISADNLLSGRPITVFQVRELLPFAHQAAAAIQKATLLKSTNDELARRIQAEEELRLQAVELVQARDAAIVATHAKSQFLANMSHEIRTPMSGVLGMNSILLGTELNPQQREIAIVIQHSAESLLTVINDVLDYSKIEAHKMLIERTDFDLRKCVEEIADMMTPRLAGKPVELNCYIPPEFPHLVEGDPVRVRQVLTNLIANAVKFTELGHVSVDVRILERRGTHLRARIEICDTGIGIAPDRRESIFESFTQADGSMSRKYGGTGLGLTITRQLVELMGGSIGFDSQEGVGTGFWVEFDFGIAQNLDESSLRISSKGPLVVDKWDNLEFNVLVAEDNSVNLMILESALAALNCRVESVADGLAAIAAYRAGSFDVVLMDLQMPVMDGIEAAKQIRQYEAGTGRRTPIIALTAHALQGDRERCLEAGMDDYLSKPIRRAELVEKLKQWGANREYA